jgi:hypothetical protein
MSWTCVGVSGRYRFVQAMLRCSAVLFVLLLVGMAPPALAASPITGVTVSVTLSKSVLSGDAVYAKATVEGTGDYDHRVTWSLSPDNAGTISPTGLFISSPTFTGTATLRATSVETPKFSGTADVIVSAGSDAVHVDHNNLAPGVEDGSARHPYRTIQGAVEHAVNGDTVKVAQGTYTENVLFTHAVLLLGGFKGASPEDYAANQPGDFVTRSTDHVTLVTIIQSTSRDYPVVTAGSLSPPNPLTYAVDGFTLTGGFNGLLLDGSGQVDCFVSQNLITNNGPETPVTYNRGGGIKAEGVNTLVLNNQIVNNQTDWGGGFYIDTDANSFLVQGNLIENNIALGGSAGGGVLGQANQGQPPGLFTWNLVRGNRAGDLISYGQGGGITTSGGPMELSHNVYANNMALDQGGGIFVSGSAVLRHELVYKNSIAGDYGAAGVQVHSSTGATLEHCTIAGNVNSHAGSTGGLYVEETATAQVSNSIIWDNSENQVYAAPGATLTMTYSDSQTYAGTGNISVDPLFADPAADDYHLKSKKGRWNPATSRWVWDAVHSPGIDAGDPAAAFDQEPIPNGARTNMGVYGNTPEASKSQQDLMGAGILLILQD